MTLSEWLVLFGGIAAIVWVNWYFFFASAGGSAAADVHDGVQEITVAVRGGYEPRSIKVRPNRPVRLLFDRQETSGCSEEVVLGDFGIRRFLPPYEKTAVEFTPTESGAFEFTCGMGMLRGQIIVEEESTS